ncbi:MAG: CDP-diacylglycerol--serine O-phosphatidyltransferase [Bdellovibrio sp. CG12_big_fil_rev_8_21_14_0_65_39_13]|nr:MAG: CDP-diacylglycerol--serine O-phosphatidyltransferase [Bdellovibrio sp. CG22_combo_CG10-13_8_21_14_all_39_27]PIQ61289.1 MAG: CDP-diacylglycerol--serine O-phosphatidyltransferase [Bdellovibrio sp. CG12_big_fil_rev_8_21_14_0_65_39_13]PIR36720.1 MAG: CDP-diacylglycerol--serine O-phosphatidyltransferase [Bdellovibrio sp. CG11_big_fil_rev_8_21_14_0_20_39_38]PJB53443.1 MAG: CDP-diacylglycerol--serine O-phosphatidyltransferase [Bdellovibrio sp. CG_4_9_14_3_um_filter_39_7]
MKDPNVSGAKRLAFFLPNSFTALNMACGFSSIILSLQGRAFDAALILVLGAIFDSVDGRVARMTGTQSEFGEQFDSISDVISFGIAPSLLIYLHSLQTMGRIGAVVSFIYLLCGALRLARFNANIDKVSSDFFQGLPIPGGALVVIGFVFISNELKMINDFPVAALIITFVTSILMISNIPFCSFKNSQYIRDHKRKVLFLMFILGVLTFTYYTYMFFINMAVYIVASIIYYLFNRKQAGDIFEWKSDKED